MLSTSSQEMKAHAAALAHVRQQFMALTGDAGVFQPKRAKLILTGADRVRWLNGMATNNIRDLAVGRGVYAFLLNAQGHIQADLYAYNRAASFLVDIEGAQKEKVLSLFNHYIIMDDVEVEDVSEKLASVWVIGPTASQVLNRCGFDDSNLETLQIVNVSWRDGVLTITRRDDPAVPAYELWIASDRAQSLVGSLAEAGATPVEADAMELLRIAEGIPRYVQDIHDRELPQETNQLRALHFAKGCYIGQEIVERIRSRGAVHRLFTGFTVEGDLPEPGSKIQLQNKEVGEITSAATLPIAAPVGEGEYWQNVALGYLRREYANAEQALEAGDAQLKIAELPFRFAFGKTQLTPAHAESTGAPEQGSTI